MQRLHLCTKDVFMPNVALLATAVILVATPFVTSADERERALGALVQIRSRSQPYDLARPRGPLGVKHLPELVGVERRSAMSYIRFFSLFRVEVAAVGLRGEFSDNWMGRLESSLPAESTVLSVPEFAFFATALQTYTNYLGDRKAFHSFMEDVAAKVNWIKTKQKGSGVARRLAQASPDGPISSLFEIYSAWKVDASPSATLMELDYALADGKDLDAKFDVDGQPILIECFASMTTDFVTRGVPYGYWGAEGDPVIPKIRNKILNKADQATTSTLPVAVFIAPSADFLMPAEKIPRGVTSAFAQAKCRSVSAVVFTGGSHPYLCDHIAWVFENTNATHPLNQSMRELFDSLKPD